MRSFILSLFIIAFVFCEVKEENGILVLTDVNFQQTIKEHDSMFIEFYSTKQKDSLMFIHTLETIVKRFNDKGVHPVVAKIDHANAPEVAKIYRIGRFPVIYHFKKGSPRFFDGDLIEADVELFIEKNVHPDVVIVKSDAEIEAQVARGFPVVVGHFQKKSSKEFKNYRKACLAFTDFITLAVIGDNSDVSIPVNQVDIYADGVKRTYTEKMTVKELKKWICIKSLPPVIPYMRKYMKYMFAKDNGVFDHLLFISSKEYFLDHPELKETLERIANDFVGQLFVVNLYDSEHGMMEFFGVDPSTLPTLTLVKNGDNQVSKFAFRGLFEEESIREYIKSYFDGTLEPYYKSEEPYAERDGNVKVLVRSDFEEYVFNPNVNVLVEFVVSRCPRCDSLRDDINTLAGYFIDVPDIDVARIDISKNDLEGIEMKSYPMFYFYPAGEGRTQKSYEREIDLAGLMRFIHENRVKVDPRQVLQDMMPAETEKVEVEVDPESEVETVDDEL